MSIKQELFASFIKGIGKTIGTVAVFGFLGIFYVYSSKSFKKYVKKQTKESIEHTENLNVETEDNMDDISSENVEVSGSVTNENVNDYDNLMDTKYKLIFDKLLN